MAGPITTAVANRVHGKMQGGPGGKTFDPTIIIAIIQAIMQLFTGCKVPAAKARQIAEDVANQTGFGHRLYTRWYHQTVEQFAPEEDAAEYAAALLDEAGPTSGPEYAAMMTESQTP